jgi:hypothetical protein
MLSANRPRAGARRLSAPRCGARGEGCGLRSGVIQASVLNIFRGGRSTLNLWVSLRVLQQSNQLRTQSFATLGGNAVQSGQKKRHRRNSNCLLSAFSCGSTVIGSTAAHPDQ